jgi:hypothetical protein
VYESKTVSKPNHLCIYHHLRDANLEHIKAVFNHGILSIAVPKEEQQRKEILISSST